MCCSAAGEYVTPMLIFPRVKRNDVLLEGSPDGSIAAYNKTAWMTKELFLVWLKHFIGIVRPRITGQILLLLDGHCSHMSKEAIMFAIANKIYMLIFPPHTTHKLQRCTAGTA